MDQDKASTQTRLLKLLQHYDIKDFTQFLVKKKFLSSSEVLPRSKKEAIIYIINKDKCHTQFLKVVEEYKAYVTDDVTTGLIEIKLSLTSFKQELYCDTKSDSLSSSSFSDDSDTAVNICSQEIPTGSGECSGMLPETDSGYYTQSNTSQSQNLSATCSFPPVNFPTEDHRQKRPEQTQHPRQRTKNVYNITHNYSNCNCYMADSASIHRKQLPLSSLETDYQTKACVTKGYDKELPHVLEKIGKFKKALRTCNFELTECMNVQSLLPYLQQEGLLTPNEYEKLSQADIHNKTSREQNHYLLGILPSKGEQTCEQFIKCLSLARDHSGHARLVKLLTSVA